MSWIAGALCATALYRPQRPVYLIDLPRRYEAAEAPPAPLWLRPAPADPALPELCVFLENKQRLQPVSVPYSATGAGSLRLVELWRLTRSAVVVLGARLPPCPALALLAYLGGPDGLLFRSYLKLAAAQVLRLPAAPPAVPGFSPGTEIRQRAPNPPVAPR